MLNVNDPIIRDVMTRYISWLNTFDDSQYTMDDFPEFSKLIYRDDTRMIIEAGIGDEGGPANLFVEYMRWSDEKFVIESLCQSFDNGAVVIYPVEHELDDAHTEFLENLPNDERNHNESN